MGQRGSPYYAWRRKYKGGDGVYSGKIKNGDCGYEKYLMRFLGNDRAGNAGHMQSFRDLNM